MARSWPANLVAGFLASPQGNVVARHVASCESCIHHFKALPGLEARLTRDARRAVPAVPVGLDQRIIQAVDRSVRPQPDKASRTGWFPLAGALAGAGLAAVLVLQPSSPVAPDASVARPPLVVSISGDEPGVIGLWRSMAPPAGGLLGQNPLQAEAELVYSDAQSAVRFLALNFLPSAAAATAAPGPAGRGV